MENFINKGKEYDNKRNGFVLMNKKERANNKELARIGKGQESDSRGNQGKAKPQSVNHRDGKQKKIADGDKQEGVIAG